MNENEVRPPAESVGVSTNVIVNDDPDASGLSICDMSSLLKVSKLVGIASTLAYGDSGDIG